MITRIGIVSGKVLALLEELKRPLTVDEVEFYIDVSYELVLMSIGWLVQRGIVHVDTNNIGEYLVYLSEESPRGEQDQDVQRLTRKGIFDEPNDA